MSIIHNIYHTKIYILTSCKPIQLLICQKNKERIKSVVPDVYRLSGMWSFISAFVVEKFYLAWQW